MSLILPPKLQINWERASKVRNLVGSSLYDYKEFKPLIGLYLKKNDDLKDFCRKTKQDYLAKLKRLFEIEEQRYGDFTVLLPRFMSVIDIQRDNDLYKEWDKAIVLIIPK